MNDLLINPLTYQPTYWVTDWQMNDLLIHPLTYQPTYWVTDWQMNDLLIHPLTYQPTYWVTDTLAGWPAGLPTDHLLSWLAA